MRTPEQEELLKNGVPLHQRWNCAYKYKNDLLAAIPKFSTWSEVAAHIGLTRARASTCWFALCKLGEVKPSISAHLGSVRTRKSWVPTEDEQLRTLLSEGMTDDDIALAMGRTVGSVLGRINVLKLSRKALKSHIATPRGKYDV